VNIDDGKIYPSRKAALEAGVPEDRLVTGSKKAIEELNRRLFPKRKRSRMRAKART
jgi:hypothetical protein